MRLDWEYFYAGNYLFLINFKSWTDFACLQENIFSWNPVKIGILNHVWWTQKGGKKMRNIPFYAPSKSWRGAYHVLNVLEFQHNSFFPLSLLALPPSSTPHLNHGVEHTIHQPKRCSACDQICIAFSGYFFPIGMAGTVV